MRISNEGGGGKHEEENEIEYKVTKHADYK